MYPFATNLKWQIGIFLFALTLICNPQVIHAQFFVNGADVHSTSNSIIYVQTDSVLLEDNAYFEQEGLLQIDRDLIVNSGKIEIDGTVDIDGNLINNDSIVGLSTSSLILLNGNWTNNNVFLAGLNTTVLDGGIQSIGGSRNSTYYNLDALGSLADVKRLMGVNASVLNDLDLTDVEFATNNNNLSVYNTNINAIQRNTGFVSSLDTGKLERATNNGLTYLFPTGSSVGVLRYRPIEITPNTLTVDTFGVRLANTDATNEGFDVLMLGDSLCAVNPNFYHRIYGNSDAAITMFYVPQDDGEWDAMAQWQDSDNWTKLPNEFPANAGQFSTMTIPSWSDFSNNSFALGAQQPSLELDDELTVELGQSVELEPSYIGANPQNILWFPLDQISCPNCLETTVSPIENTVYNLEITVNQYCVVRDSILILVNSPELFLPTAFSPNIDGTNDTYRPLNNNLEEYNMVIYNRWGEVVFRTDDFTVGWDGTYKGNDAELGVYSYSAEYRFINKTDYETQQGNVTLIR